MSTTPRNRRIGRWLLGISLGLVFVVVGVITCFPTERIRQGAENMLNQLLTQGPRRPSADSYRVRIDEAAIHWWRPALALRGIHVDRTPAEGTPGNPTSLTIDSVQVALSWSDVLFHIEQPNEVQATWTLLGSHGSLEAVLRPSPSSTPAMPNASAQSYQLHLTLSPVSLAAVGSFLGDVPLQGTASLEAESTLPWPLRSTPAQMPLHASLHINDLALGNGKTPLNLRAVLPKGSEVLLKKIPVFQKIALGGFQGAIDGSASISSVSTTLNLYTRFNPSFAVLKQALTPAFRQLLEENPELAPLYNNPALGTPAATTADYERVAERVLLDSQREDKLFGLSLTGAIGFTQVRPAKKEPAGMDLRAHPLPAAQ